MISSSKKGADSSRLHEYLAIHVARQDRLLENPHAGIGSELCSVRLLVFFALGQLYRCHEFYLLQLRPRIFARFLLAKWLCFISW